MIEGSLQLYLTLYSIRDIQDGNGPEIIEVDDVSDFIFYNNINEGTIVQIDGEFYIVFEIINDGFTKTLGLNEFTFDLKFI